MCAPSPETVPVCTANAGEPQNFVAAATVLDILVQSRRDTRAGKRLLRKLLKRQCRVPRVMVTDKLASYGAAKREVMPSVEHRRHKGLNNRAENSHQPTRRRERQMKRFKSAGHPRAVLGACRAPRAQAGASHARAAASRRGDAHADLGAVCRPEGLGV